MKILFDDDTTKVYQAYEGEDTFVLNKKTNVTLRISNSSTSTVVTFDHATVIPTDVGGLPVFRFTKSK